MGYQDDITLGGPLHTVVSDVRKIAEQGARMGLVLSASKCEIIADSKLVVDYSLLGSFTRITVKMSSLLGAPMFPGKMLDEVWSSRCADLTAACDRLGLVSSQDAPSLFGESFSAPKVQHLLRCSPSPDLKWIDKFDDLLNSAVSGITNNAQSDSQLLQATLPIKNGGLGLRRVASHFMPFWL